MPAPSTDRPVTITVRDKWRLRVKPPPPRPPRLSVAVTVLWTVLTVTRVIFGVVYFNDCPQQPNIPNFLLGLAFIPLLMIPFVIFPCESNAAQPREHPRGVRACMLGLESLSVFLWTLAGDVWVFSVYQPNYDPAAADGVYCDKTLYTFAFWNAVWGTFVISVILTSFCIRLLLLCCVMMSSAPTGRDFNPATQSGQDVRARVILLEDLEESFGTIRTIRLNNTPKLGYIWVRETGMVIFKGVP